MRQQARAKLESRLVDKEIELQAVRQKLEEVCVVCVRERGREREHFVCGGEDWGERRVLWEAVALLDKI